MLLVSIHKRGYFPSNLLFLYPNECLPTAQQLLIDVDISMGHTPTVSAWTHFSFDLKTGEYQQPSFRESCLVFSHKCPSPWHLSQRYNMDYTSMISQMSQISNSKNAAFRFFSLVIIIVFRRNPYRLYTVSSFSLGGHDSAQKSSSVTLIAIFCLFYSLANPPVSNTRVHGISFYLDILFDLL